MKKALIAALLVVSAAFASCLPNIADFPDRTSELARAATSPLIWQFWDELLSRELAQWIPTDSDDCQKSEWAPEFRNAITCPKGGILTNGERPLHLVLSARHRTR